ncbi:uncharacterized protein LOC116266684 [Nymphaea colorata]|uniref:uncharacterized protein LOC116266684 n=1 Tax=Nymphaea colorata TaxID=210225 RepID=UPI00129E6626|nr:uncharacterized protein LOC116266684 [Nymphaea colorata]
MKCRKLRITICSYIRAIELMSSRDDNEDSNWPLRSYQEGMHSNVMKVREKVFVDLVSSEDDDMKGGEKVFVDYLIHMMMNDGYDNQYNYEDDDEEEGGGFDAGAGLGGGRFGGGGELGGLGGGFGDRAGVGGGLGGGAGRGFRGGGGLSGLGD